MELRLQEDDFLTIHIEDETLNIEVDEHTHASLWLTYDSLKHLSLHCNLHASSQLNLLLDNKGQEDLTITFMGNVFHDAKLHLGFLEVEKGNSQIQTKIILKEPYAKADMITASLVNSKKHYVVDMVHESRDSEGIMNHYAVVQNQANYVMKASGIIQKGAYQSASHQKTRVLTMTHEHRCKVDPILLIDEDQVKASHAMTLGQMDENQLYYLMSRGLTRQEALGLISTGYLMPICYFFDDDKISERLKNEMEKKVGLHV